MFSADYDELSLQQNRLSFPVAYHPDGGSEDDSKVVETSSPSQALDGRKLEQKYVPHLPCKAAPLSNRERLVLRKQALKMKKRPVLAIGIILVLFLILFTTTSNYDAELVIPVIGRNNVITGVAKTIRTHFKKHPLAIVNIKNRADGTPVQQLISELEVCKSTTEYC